MKNLFLSKEEKVEMQSYAMVIGIMVIIIILIIAVPFFIKKVKENQPIIDTAYDYDVAYIQLANGGTVIVEIDKWQDSADGE